MSARVRHRLNVRASVVACIVVTASMLYGCSASTPAADALLWGDGSGTRDAVTTMDAPVALDNHLLPDSFYRGFGAQLQRPYNGQTNVSTSPRIGIYITTRVDGSDDYTPIEASLELRERGGGPLIPCAFTYQAHRQGSRDAGPLKRMNVTATPIKPLTVDKEYVIKLVPTTEVIVNSWASSEHRFRVGSRPQVISVHFISKPPRTLAYARVKFSEPFADKKAKAKIETVGKVIGAAEVQASVAGSSSITVNLPTRPKPTVELTVTVPGNSVALSGKKLFGDAKKGEGSDFVLTTVPAKLPGQIWQQP